MSNRQDGTAAQHALEAIAEWSVSVVFVNLGSDHPSVIEAMAVLRDEGRDQPAMVICPHETTALSAAHGYAQASGRAQAVIVHTDVGTANLGGALHNAARSRIPVFILAGLTPYTLEGELPGSRNTQVNHMQDVHDQHGIVRPYAKWSYDIRTPHHAAQVVHRGMQFALSHPQAPVYVTGAREVFAERSPRMMQDLRRWRPIIATRMPEEITREIVTALEGAENPLIITSYLGREEDAVTRLVEFVELLGVPVVEVSRSALNFPSSHLLHLGYQVKGLIESADVVVVVDADSPWIHTVARPKDDASVYFIDVDPLKEDLPLWYMPSAAFIRALGADALTQLLAVAHEIAIDEQRRVGRVTAATAIHDEQRAAWAADAEENDRLTAELAMHTLHALIDDETIVMNEAITNMEAVLRHVPRELPGTLFGNRGTSLGWSGGAALGIKMARPDRRVVSIVGDGTYQFSIPSSTYWVAERYGIPFLTVILDNGGWNATKQNVQLLHRGGAADRSGNYWVNLAQTADLPGVAAAAGGAWAATVDDAAEIEDVLAEAIRRVDAGQSAVVSVLLSPVSNQEPESPGSA